MAQISGMVLLRNRATKIVGISCSTSAATGSVHPCQGGDGAELESAMRADHHHAPVTIQPAGEQGVNV